MTFLKISNIIPVKISIQNVNHASVNPQETGTTSLQAV
jgi:hypothetical protein